MKTVLRLCGWPTEFDGQYLRDFDFEASGGLGCIDMTPDVDLAMQFDDLHSALVFLTRSPECAPLREDGKPNRPLTATTWEFISRDPD